MQYRISDLLTQLKGDHGQDSARGRFTLWLEACYAKIRVYPWSWNYEKTDAATLAPVVIVETYDLTKGSNVIATNLGGNTTATQAYTGRHIILDEQAYRIVSVGLTAADEIELDRAFIGESVTDQTITLHRIDFVVRASAIKSVEVDNVLAKKISKEMFYASQKQVINYLNFQQDAAPVFNYTPDNSFKIPKPKYPPFINDTGGGTGPAAGEYEYFFTYKDTETGQESAPGPSLVFTGTGNLLEVYYRATGATNVGENTYSLVLYRSLAKDGELLRYPMFEVGTKDPADNTDFVTDNIVDASLLYNDRFYDGHYARVVWLSYPDDIYRVHILHTKGWGGRPHDDDWIELGDRNELIDAISHYFEMKRANQNRDPTQNIAANRAFIGQLVYLLSEDEGDNIDVDDWTQNIISPYDDYTSDYSVEETWKLPFF